MYVNSNSAFSIGKYGSSCSYTQNGGYVYVYSMVSADEAKAAFSSKQNPGTPDTVNLNGGYLSVSSTSSSIPAFYNLNVVVDGGVLACAASTSINDNLTVKSGVCYLKNGVTGGAVHGTISLQNGEKLYNQNLVEQSFSSGSVSTLVHLIIAKQAYSAKQT